MIGDAGRTSSIVSLTRPRSARPFLADDVQRLDRLRPWLAHAFRPRTSGDLGPGDQIAMAVAGAPARSGEMILTVDSRLVFQTPSLELLLTILAGEPANYLRPLPRRDRLTSPVLKLLRRITGAASGTSNTPPRMQTSTAYGILTLEAKWLVPAGTFPEDAAKDPKSCLIAVTIELREHAIAHAARVLRESGATPRQTKIGIQLALGNPKPAIADELGIQVSSVVDLTKKLYQTLDVHNSTELATKIWLDQNRSRHATAQDRPRACPSRPMPRKSFLATLLTAGPITIAAQRRTGSTFGHRGPFFLFVQKTLPTACHRRRSREAGRRRGSDSAREHCFSHGQTR
jgi:DNA-binding CsgD family transcriptional regulator